MSALTVPLPRLPMPSDQVLTMADVVERLGGVPTKRILIRPPVGAATVQDVVNNPGCELIDAVLVEKAMGFYESRLGAVLVTMLEIFLMRSKLGFTLEGEALVQVALGQVRRPDVSVFLWERFPNRQLPAGQILLLLPDLAAEILSPGNTEAEMDRKRGEYFQGGTRLVWQVYPIEKTVRVYTTPDVFQILGESDTLDGGDVIPGFSLSIREWFELAGQRSAQ